MSEKPKKPRNSGGNSHQRSVARTKTPIEAAGPDNDVLAVNAARSDAKPKRLWQIILGWPVIAVVGPSVALLGFSMTPQEVRFAYGFFVVGYLILLTKAIEWIVFERNDSRLAKVVFVLTTSFVIGAACYGSILFAHSKNTFTVAKPYFTCYTTDVLNMPERKTVKNTWDGKPWNDTEYADVRFSIENKADALFQNLDLTVGPGDEKGFRIAAIDQLSEVPGVEFPKSQFPDFTLKVMGNDDRPHTLVLPTSKMALPTTTVKLYAAKLVQNQSIKVILGITQGKPSGNSAPKELHIKGTYETSVNGTPHQAKLDEIVPVN
jgi:hypothetical protein